MTGAVRPSAGAAPDAVNEPSNRGGRRWRPARSHRIRSLSPTGRTVAIAILVALALLPLLSAAVVLRQGFRPSGDNALIGLRVHDVLEGRLPLVGQPSTGENFGSGVESSHPGPIEFYLLAPFVALLGPTAGLVLGAAAINAAALVGVGWTAFRRGGMPLMLIAVGGVTLLTRSLGGNFLHDPVSSNVGAFTALMVLFASWSIIAGDLRTTPVFVLAGTFALQDHLSFLGTGAPVIGVALIIGIWWIRQILRRATDRAWLRPRLLASAVLGAVLWFPVVWDQFFGSHNVGAIVETFTTGRSDGKGSQAAGVSFAAKRVAEALAPWPIFSRKIPPLGYLHTPAAHELVLGYVVLVVVLGLGVWFWRTRRTDLVTMAGVAALAVAAGFYTAVKVPSGATVKAANLRWMWTVSAFAWTALVWMLWNLLSTRMRKFVEPPAVALVSVVILFAMASTVTSIGLSTDRDGTIAQDTTSLVKQVERRLPKGRYRVTYDGGSVVLSIGPALVHDLEHRGDVLLLDIGPFGRAYGEERQYRDQEVDGTILVSADDKTGYPDGAKWLGRQVFHVNANDKDLQTIRVFLVDGASDEDRAANATPPPGGGSTTVPDVIPAGQLDALCQDLVDGIAALGPGATALETAKVIVATDFDRLLALAPGNLKPDLETIRAARPGFEAMIERNDRRTELDLADLPAGFGPAAARVAKFTVTECR